MIGLDTNVLVRLLVEDDADQHAQVVALLQGGVEEGHAFFVGDVVLAEVVGVLQGRYRLSRTDVGGALAALFEAEHLTFESADRCLRALRRFQAGGGGFADYLIAERAKDGGCESLATFDRALSAESDCRAP